MGQQIRLSLNILIYKSGHFWIAHCLQTDVVSEGDSVKEALANVFQLMALQFEVAGDEGDFDSIFRPAPPEYWNLYSRGADVEGDMPPLVKYISHVEAREAVLV